MFPSRHRRGADRYTPVRIALIFLAAGVWLAGVITGSLWITGAAIVILLVALALQIAGRHRSGG
jgi:hypothetical protein